MAFKIDKPTLNDFIENPIVAMRNGYYPDFMSCLALKASHFNFSHFMFIKDEFFELFWEEVIIFPLALVCFILHLFFLLMIPFIFPIWALVYWLRMRPKYIKYHKKKKSVLIINEIDDNE